MMVVRSLEVTKICTGGQIPSKMSHSFIQNYCWITLQVSHVIIEDERLVSKMEGKTKFSRRLKQFDGLTRLTDSDPIVYER